MGGCSPGTHSDCTDRQDGLATKFVDVEKRRNSGEQHNDTDDTGGEKGNGITRETEILENGGSIVEDGVDTSPLLEEPGFSSQPQVFRKVKRHALTW